MSFKKSQMSCKEDPKNISNSKHWWYAFIFITLISFMTRFYKVEEPDHICWDETHFGKMGSWYINRTFFFDVHPPLGKMLIAASGYLTGYDGSFPFDKPGDKYNNVSYVGMRVFCTFLGAWLPPLGFLIVWELTFSLISSVFGALFILCDVGVLTLTQYILLDPFLLFFMMSATYGITKFYNCSEIPFSKSWWFWLSYTGSMLACTISVKFVGLFVILFVGVQTLYQLWDILGDLSKPIVYTMKHFIARTICLIVLPAFIYIFFFYIHLKVLSKSGNGDGFYSSAFQSILEGNSLHNASMPREVAFGAIVTFKNHRTGGGYLHSHWHLYPDGVGARQQQITTYTHKDDNNKWLIKPFNNVPDDDKEIKIVKSGDLVRLEHVPTRRNLHSHKEPAPLTKKHLQVTGYGENGTGDANDVWRIQILNSDPVVSAVTSKLKFVHYLQNCVLTTTGKQLPKWAYEQQEVTCNPNLRDKFAAWNVEDNIYDSLPSVSFNLYAPSFIERFIESHAVMLQGNAGLKPKEGEVTSRPWQWPVNYRGQFFSGGDYRIYLLGNPIIWWSNLFFLLNFVITFMISSVHRQRNNWKRPDVETESEWKLLTACCWLFLAWMLHYIPFYAMGRVLYFHHYFPALLYNSMLSGVMITYILSKTNVFFPPHIADYLFQFSSGFILTILIYSFYLFSPLSYGMSGSYSVDPNSTMYGLKWMDSWEF